ncbi:murein transglycosylase [Synergistales bacterium]|nr:murein transglycosylase [Synergistales bacterium]
MNRLKTAVFLLLIAILSANGAEGADFALLALFQKRDWAVFSAAYNALKSPSPQEHSLMANALRYQNKWNEASAILEKHARNFPAELRPYADMTLILGYEKFGKYDAALKLSVQLEKNAPSDLRYTLAYAQYRIMETGKVDGLERPLKKMLAAAETKTQKIAALSRLVKLPGNRSADALALLELTPSDKAAYNILSADPKPRSAAVSLSMGEHAYLRGDNKAAIELLSAVPQNAPGYRKALYYRAYSLYRLKRYSDALNLWGRLAISGNSWAESATRRIATLAGTSKKPGPLKKDAAAVLARIVKERKGKVQARAMYALSDLLEGSEKKAIEDGLIQAYPESINTVKTLWRRGWDAWNKQNAEEALRWWRRVYSPSLDSTWKARVLYWIGSAELSLGHKAESDKTYSRLARNHPLSIYTFLARPGALKLLEGDPPELAFTGKSAKLTPLETKALTLEQWGFIHFAKSLLERSNSTARELYHSISLSEWLGDDDAFFNEAYAGARLLTRHFTSGTVVYRKGLERLYPRPFKKQVEAFCKKYGVESNFMWSIMKQESAFKPSALSHAGASGLMQLMPGTARGEAKRAGLEKYDVFNVTDNITLGASHLSWLGKQFARKDWIMAAYNAGGGNARKWLADGKDGLAPDYWIEEVRFDETCDYVQKVSGNLEVYRLLYDNKK